MQNTDTVLKSIEANNFKSEHYRTIYSNLMRFRLNFTDLGIVFGVVDDKPGKIGTLGFKEEVTIILSYFQVAALADTLSTLLRLYEEEFGEAVEVPKALLVEKEQLRSMVLSLKNLGLANKVRPGST
jgi:Protein of unknown function (DUF3467)